MSLLCVCGERERESKGVREREREREGRVREEGKKLVLMYIYSVLYVPATPGTLCRIFPYVVLSPDPPDIILCTIIIIGRVLGRD